MQRKPRRIPTALVMGLALLWASAAWAQATNDPQIPAAETELLRQAQRALAAGDAASVIRHASRYTASYPQGAYHSRMQYLLAQSELLAGQPQAAEERMDWLSRNGESEWRGWGLYGQGQAALARGDTAEALRLLRQTATLSSHPARAPALLLLGHLYDSRGEAQQAVRYLTLYREAFPQGMIPVLDHGIAGSAQADALAEVLYTVQVGVFGDRANALRQKERFEALNQPVRLTTKTVAGQKYTAVWVGRYRTQQAAVEARRQFEAKFGDTYRVVVSK
jgi:outer membrane protein assembly factor BamD (BamD/ComL family)